MLPASRGARGGESLIPVGATSVLVGAIPIRAGATSSPVGARATMRRRARIDKRQSISRAYAGHAALPAPPAPVDTARGALSTSKGGNRVSLTHCPDARVVPVTSSRPWKVVVPECCADDATRNLVTRELPVRHGSRERHLSGSVLGTCRRRFAGRGRAAAIGRAFEGSPRLLRRTSRRHGARDGAAFGGNGSLQPQFAGAMEVDHVVRRSVEPVRGGPRVRGHSPRVPQ
jgi:hypothetical protein